MVLSRYGGPSEQTVLFLDMLYLGAKRLDAFMIAREKYGKDTTLLATTTDTICQILFQPQVIAYLQLLSEGILNPINSTADYPKTDFKSRDFEKINLRYSFSVEDSGRRTLVKFYRQVIMHKVIKGEGTFNTEDESMQSILSRNPIGGAEQLKKILWRKISNPHKETNPGIVKQYMDLCDMSKDTINDKEIKITFTQFDANNPLPVSAPEPTLPPTTTITIDAEEVK